MRDCTGLGLVVCRERLSCGRSDNRRICVLDPLARTLAEFVVAGKRTAGMFEVNPCWDGHWDVGGEYGQQH